MAQFVWQDLIDRARVYVDDDHDDDRSWIADDKWLRLAIVEYEQLYKRWIRLGITLPSIADLTFSSGTLTISGALAVVGVAHDDGSRIRLLDYCPDVIWKSTGAPTGDARQFTAASGGDTVVLTLDPTPASNFSEYHVKYVLLPTLTNVEATDSVELPTGGDERLVLGLAKRAHIKDSGRSSTIDELIRDADAEIHFAAAGKMKGGPKVKVLPKASRPSSTPRGVSWPDRASWLWL